VKRKESGEAIEGEVVGVLPQENLDVSKGDLLGRRGIGLGGSGGGAGDERVAFSPLGRVMGLTASSSSFVAGILKGCEVSSRQLGAKTAKLAGTRGITRRSQVNAVSRMIGEGKPLDVSSAIERVGEVASALLSSVEPKGSSAKGETGLKDQS